MSPFAPACAHCGRANQPNVVTAVVALVALAVLGVAVSFALQVFWPKAARQSPAAVPATTTEPKTDDYGWLVQAMADCDVYAKQNTDILYFLIIPVTASGQSVPGWQAGTIGELGNAAMLLRSTDTLVGLRNGAYVIYRKPFTFAVRDDESKTVYKWKPSVGVSELKSHEITAASLTLGIALGDSQDVDWGPALPFGKGTCYWTNPLIAADR